MRIRSTKPEFWRSVTVSAVAPEVIYDGPMPTGRRPYAGLAPAVGCTEYVYLLFGEQDELVYVGRSFRPADRFTKHRRKPWWPQVAGLVLLRITGATPREATALTDGLERLAIKRLGPTGNIAGVAS
jgi:hypothetical protein